MSMIEIGGPKCYKQFIHGDLVASLHWVNDEPAMIITPKLRTIQGAFIIGLSSAYKYTDTRYLIQQATVCANHIGMDASAYTVRRICDLILERIMDLINMPPERMVIKKNDIKKQVVGEMNLQVNGEKIVEQEMTVEVEG